MENKKKAKGTVLSLVLSILLVLNLVVCGVAIALSVANVTLGGSITFNAKHVNATISAGQVSGGTLNGTGKMQAITLDATHDGATEIATWSGLDLEFNESGDDVTISFAITNNSEEYNLLATLITTEGTQDNATMTVSAKKGETTLDNVGAVVIEKKSSETTTSVEYTIKFSVTDKNKSASISGFALKFNLEKTELDSIEYHTVTLNDEDNINKSGVSRAPSPFDDTLYEILYYAVDGSSEVKQYVSGTTISAYSKIWVSTENTTPIWSEVEGISFGSDNTSMYFDDTTVYFNLWVNGEKADFISYTYNGSGAFKHVSAIVPITEDTSICFEYANA